MPGGRARGIKAALQSAIGRLIRPFLVRQRAIDDRLLSGILAAQEELRANHQQLVAAIGELQRELEVDRRRIDGLEMRLTTHEQRHVARPFMTEPWSEWDDPLAGHVEGFRSGAGVADGDSYTSFEHRFRGTRERILELQRPYVGLLRDHEPVLDCGCGRGELLELLAQAGVAASGVDLDAGMLADARERGLQVSEGDAISALQERGAASLGAVVAMQVIEHLPEPELLAFLRGARRALAPGGRLIVETVNPHAIEALNGFWLDPTHQHPLFPDVVLELCRGAGFDQGFVMFPGGSGDVRRDRGVCAAYAVVADVG